MVKYYIHDYTATVLPVATDTVRSTQKQKRRGPSRIYRYQVMSMCILYELAREHNYCVQRRPKLYEHTSYMYQYEVSSN